VYALEVALLVATLLAMAPLIQRSVQRAPLPPSAPLARDPLDTLVEFYAKK
jgi:hypothetical protein